MRRTRWNSGYVVRRNVVGRLEWLVAEAGMLRARIQISAHRYLIEMEVGRTALQVKRDKK